MKLLLNFINFGNACPVCGGAMTLFMHLRGSVCFKATETFPIEQDFNYGQLNSIFNLIKPDRRLEFIPTFGYDKGYSKNSEIEPGDNMIVNVPYGDPITVEFKTQSCFKKIKDSALRFFYICNPDAVEKDAGNSFGINAHHACFYRSSPFMRFQDENLILIDQKQNSVNWQEVATIKKIVNNIEKTYILSLDFIESNTKFFYYHVDMKEDTKTFRPKVLEKTFNHIINRPDFSSSGREKLLTKLESWVWMS